MGGTRGKGEGSVYQLANGRWRASIETGWTSKGRQRRTVSAASKRECLAKLAKLREEVGVGIIGDNPTVSDWLDYWLTYICPERGLKPSTIRGYRSYVEGWLKPHLGRRRARELTPDHVRRLHRAMREKGAAAATIRQAHAILSRALKVAARDGLVGRNVAALVDVPSAGDSHHAALTVDEAKRVLRAAAAHGDPRALARLACALILGMRQGEALGLRWAAVDLEAQTIDVAWALTRGTDGEPTLVPPKSASSRRIIPLPDALVPILRVYADRPEDPVWVFPGSQGGPERNAKRDWQAWRAALADAGVPAVPLHGARASAASLLRDMGCSERMIADILGHREVRITQQAYLRTTDDQRRAALQSAALELLAVD